MILTACLVRNVPLCNPTSGNYQGKVASRITSNEPEEADEPITITADILATCKQVHAEGAHLFYSLNTFTLDNDSLEPGLDYASSMKQYGIPRIALRKLPGDAYSLIRKLRVEIPHHRDYGRGMPFQVSLTLARCPQVEHLTLAVAKWNKNMKKIRKARSRERMAARAARWIRRFGVGRATAKELRVTLVRRSGKAASAAMASVMDEAVDIVKAAE